MEVRRKIWFAVAVLVITLGIILLTSKKSFASINEDVGSLSYLGFDNMPRGIRNNNPGNLVQSGIAWQGKIPLSENTDGHFEQFYTFVYGVRAMILDIKNDIEQDGLLTIEALIYEYAPPFENHTETYIEYLEGETGILRTEVIQTNQSTMRNLIQAIAKYENGVTSISNSEFNYAWNLI